MKSLLFLGRQPNLGIAELESVYGADHLTFIWDKFVTSDLPIESFNLNRLGSVLKIAEIIDEIPLTQMKEIDFPLAEVTSKHLKDNAVSSKFNLAISSYGSGMNTSELTRLTLTMKKNLKREGFSIRIIPNKHEAISTAQVIHNNLTDNAKGLEIVLVRKKDSILIAKTNQEQDIEAYTARDQARPFRDAFVGMLPPKLAQTIINLAVGQTDLKTIEILDPFCGTGVLLQEALLMGCPIVIGADLDERMVDFSRGNIDWLENKFDGSEQSITIEQGDATSTSWQKFNCVAAETYLGKPLSTIPRKDFLREIIEPVNLLHKKFLKNLAVQIASGTRICLAVPAWRTENNQFVHLSVLDQLAELGYNRIALEKVSSKDLLYFRPDQIVARELVILTRK